MHFGNADRSRRSNTRCIMYRETLSGRQESIPLASRWTAARSYSVIRRRAYLCEVIMASTGCVTKLTASKES